MTDKPPPTLLEELRRDLQLLKLKRMAEVLEDALDEAQSNQQGYGTFLAVLVRAELHATRVAATRRRTSLAKFPVRHTFDTFDWTFQPGLNVQLVKDLMTLHFIRQGRTVLLLGKPGTGKTHISIALGHLAVEDGYRVRFYLAAELLSDLYATLADGSTDTLIRKLARLDLLIIDDLRHVPPRPEYASLLYELVEARHRKKATILSSNLSINTWGKVLGNAPLTASMVDRLMDRAHVVNTKPGKSYRSEGPEAPPSGDRPDSPGGPE
jgi:DNA replication protein DnaC